MNYFQSIILGIIEGITEFFPISSTGHMILAASAMGILNQKITNLFIVSVQFGSILSVIFLYRKKLFFQKLDFYIKIFISTIPFSIIGYYIYKNINIMLNNPIIVSISLIIGGIIIIKAEKLYEKKNIKNFNKNKNNYLPINYYRALVIGLSQCISLIPGISRSATTIISGILQNVSRKDSIEFSFFISIPVVIFATFKKLYDCYFNTACNISSYELKLLLLGNLVSFITSIIAIKSFIKYLKNNNFKLFGYYRIISGILYIFFIIFTP